VGSKFGRHFRASCAGRNPLGKQLTMRLDQNPDIMAVRRETVEHPFSTINASMRATHFLTKSQGRVGTEMSLHVLAYNLKRVINIIGVRPLIQAMQVA